MSKPKLYLVDASSLFFRAFYAIRPLSNPAGLPTNAIYGYLTMILKLVKDEKPNYLVFCYDRKEPSFRKDLYQEYKANRSEMPEDLVPQLPYIYKIAEALGVQGLQWPSFEADDIIGTLTEWGLKQHCDVCIVSGDKDFAQLVKPGVELLDTMKDSRMDSNAVFMKWGIRPDQMIDYLGLVGDSSDNVPGVPGIGPKTATGLLKDYDSLDGIYQNLDKLKPNLAEKLRTHESDARLSQKLVTIVTEIPELMEKAELSQFQIKNIQRETLKSMMIELNFKNLDKQLENWGESSTESPLRPEAIVVENPATAVANESVPEHSFTVQSVTAVDMAQVLKPQQEIWGWATEHQIYLGDSTAQKVFVLAGAVTDFSQTLSLLDLKWKSLDLKEFWHALKLTKIRTEQAIWDSSLAAYMLKPGRSIEPEKLFKDFVPEYQASDFQPGEMFARHLALEQKLRSQLQESPSLNLYESVELPMTALLYQMEQKGIRLDAYALREQSEELAKLLEKTEKGIFESVGESFNINSPKQLSVILFEKLKLPPGKKTKTGFSTDNDVLSELRDQHKAVDLVLQFREYSKLKSTYVDALPLLMDDVGRVHTTYHQALTATGRLSSVNPNLQNIPIRTERGARIRKAFVADTGKMLLSVDYSQIELRILAHFCGDLNLCRAFAEDLDVHAATASEVFGVALSEVTSDQRRTAKAINFGIAYGQGAFGLAENLGVSRAEAAGIIKRYFEKFPGVGQFIEQTIENAKAKGYTESMFGRRRYMDEFKSPVASVRKFGERAAINAPIQGTASDIVKMAMVQVGKQVPLPMLLQVHDELIFEGTEEDIQKFQPRIVQLMENTVKLKVPLKVNSATGRNWDDAH